MNCNVLLCVRKFKLKVTMKVNHSICLVFCCYFVVLMVIEIVSTIYVLILYLSVLVVMFTIFAILQ